MKPVTLTHLLDDFSDNDEDFQDLLICDDERTRHGLGLEPVSSDEDEDADESVDEKAHEDDTDEDDECILKGDDEENDDSEDEDVDGDYVK